MTKLAVSILGVALLNNCTLFKSNSKSTPDSKTKASEIVQAATTIPTPAPCSGKDGIEQLSIGLDSTDFDTAAAKLKFKNANLILANKQHNLRIDLCTDFDQKNDITAIVLKIPSSTEPFVLKSQDLLTNKGLAGVAFGNVSELKLVAKISETSFVHITGGTNFGEVNVSLSSNPTDPLPLSNNDVLVGNATSGTDPFSLCFLSRAGTDLVTRKLTLGSAILKVTTCEGGISTSGTHSHAYVGFEISDSNPSLAAERNKPFIISKEDIEKGILAKVPTDFVHHNDCEAFGIDLPHAQYRVTNMGSTGGFTSSCTATLPDAPNISKGAKNALFTAKYGKNPVSAPQNLPFGNFFDLN